MVERGLSIKFDLGPSRGVHTAVSEKPELTATLVRGSGDEVKQI